MRILLSVLFFLILYRPTFSQEVRAGLGFQSITNSIQSESPSYTGVRLGSPSLTASYILNSGDAAFGSISFLNKQYVSANSSALLVEMRPRVVFKIGYEKWFVSRLAFGIGLGSYYPVGKKRSIKALGAGASDLATSASDITEYTGDFHIAIRVWDEETFSIRLDFGKSFHLTPRELEDSDHDFMSFVIEKRI